MHEHLSWSAAAAMKSFARASAGAFSMVTLQPVQDASNGIREHPELQDARSRRELREIVFAQALAHARPLQQQLECQTSRHLSIVSATRVAGASASRPSRPVTPGVRPV